MSTTKRAHDDDGGSTSENQPPNKRRELALSSTGRMIAEYWDRHPSRLARIAVMAALLPRTGANSPLRHLDAETLRYIMQGCGAIPFYRAIACTIKNPNRIDIRDAGIDGQPVIAFCKTGLPETGIFVAMFRVVLEYRAFVKYITLTDKTERFALIDFGDAMHPIVRRIEGEFENVDGAIFDRHGFAWKKIDKRTGGSTGVSVVRSDREGDEELPVAVDARPVTNLSRGDTMVEFDGCVVFGNPSRSMDYRTAIHTYDGKQICALPHRFDALYSRGKAYLNIRDGGLVVEASFVSGDQTEFRVAHPDRFGMMEGGCIQYRWYPDCISVGMVPTLFTTGSGRPLVLGITTIPHSATLPPLAEQVEMKTDMVYIDVVFTDTILVATEFDGAETELIWITRNDVGRIHVARTRLKPRTRGKRDNFCLPLIVTGLCHGARCVAMSLGSNTWDLTVDTITGDVVYHVVDVEPRWTNMSPIESHLNDRFFK